MKVKIGIVLLVLLNMFSRTALAQAYPAVVGDKFVLRQDAAKAKLNSQTTERRSGGLQLKKGVATGPERPLTTPDAVFTIKVPAAGRYQLATVAEPVDDAAPATAAHIRIQIGDERPTNRILFDAYHGGGQIAGKFEMTGQTQQVKLWLPAGIRLRAIEWKNANDPVIPAAAQAYRPHIVPPSGHPRVWVTAETLPLVKARLTQGENKPAWDKVSAAAKQPFDFPFNPQQEIFHREDLEKAVEKKAFYYLMTGDAKVGEEAVKLMSDYLSVLEFGNVTYGDITREIGRAIYTAALVYDWCHPLMDDTERRTMYHHMLRLARDMEIGWPPFMDSIINGHGNEAQISRDLLAMAIAVYNEDPVPYQYTAYTVLEQLVPMRRFEYESPRHNQGVDYGAYRLQWEMHAAWLFYRMTGMPVFDDNIKNLPYYWLYMRLPDGYMLRDGDMFSVKGGAASQPYWKQPQCMLLCYSYANDPLIKGEFEREGGLPDNPVLYLLVNDPQLKADHNIAALPQTKDFGTVLGSMVARTGWNNTATSGDVIAEIKGGGYHFANHQHADAGALQIYHRGIQVGDIGLYLSYGTPYDFNFNKRSIAHSLMLAVDPNETLRFRTKVADGGTRFNQRFPMTPEETTNDPWFDNGKVLSASFGPSKQRPSFSYFQADLTGAYSEKMTRYTRGFLFLDLGRKDVPAAIILTDDMTTTDPSFSKYWQINTLQQPERNGDGLILSNTTGGKTARTYVSMLAPAASGRETQVLSGADANSTFGQAYTVNSTKPEAHAHRIMVSPKGAHARDRFLTVFQMADSLHQPLPVGFREQDGTYQLTIADRVVCLSASADMLAAAFTFEVPQGKHEVALAGLRPGFWQVRSADGKTISNYDVEPGKNTVFFSAESGTYTVTPGRAYIRLDP
ncbi:hypothetical protein ACWKWU_18365 [Chitinophaga lutea]